MCGYCIMARKTRRRTQKEVVADAVNPHARPSPPPKRWCCMLSSDSQPAAVDMAPAVAEEAPAQDGGRRRRKTAKKGGKRKLNEFFKVMLRLRKPVPHSNTKVKPIKAVNIIV